VSIEARLQELGWTLPKPPQPGGLYSPCVQAGTMLYIAGQLPVDDGKLLNHGKLGESVTVDEGARLARHCALNALAIARKHLGTLDRLEQAVRVAGYVASGPGFVEHPKVVNGASQVLLDVMGERGHHARVAIGVAELPLGAPVEVEFQFEVKS
jgi:enamine deaminase RidA (YjgF/YER057c/UK114 family)